MLAAGNTTFAYDKNGNQITKTPPNSKPIAFAYDAANRLIAVAGMKYNSAFAYDGDGNRIGQTVGSGTYNYVNDVATALPVVLEESGPDGNIAYAYRFGLISDSGPGFDFFYQYDGLGSVVGLTDPGSKLVGRYSYDAWGGTDASIPDPKLGTDNKFRFTGEALDPETQLYYLRARYYDPGVGRFLTADPAAGFLLHPLSLSNFAYALNQPTNLADPRGLAPDLSFPIPNSSFNPSPATVHNPGTAVSTPIFVFKPKQPLMIPETLESLLRELTSPDNVPDLADAVSKLGVIVGPIAGPPIAVAYTSFSIGSTIGFFIIDTLLDLNQPTNLRPVFYRTIRLK